jgi:endonuclease/exonuclease/phosphatase family metal-dependent hydrolase
VTDARSTRFGRSVEVRFRASRRGSWYAAVTDVPGIGPVTSVALYGLLDEKSDASMHRSLSELTPLFEDRRYNRHLVLGGDFNTWTGWGARSAHLARDRTVLDRIAALGLVDCLDAARKEGRLEGCPCSLGDGCRHVRTRLDPRKPDIPYQMDYLFASKKLAKRLEICRVADEAPWPKPSDHYPIVATFSS